MVFYKRKPVHYDPFPESIRDPDEVWVIEQTGEIYESYEAYLHRLYFYQQAKFTCGVSGQSGLDFFSALRSEQEASHDVEDAFPDPLREPIMRKVQFSTISRIDNLVDHVYDEFKQDFYPGESVNVILPSQENPDGDRCEGIVREKVHLPELRDSEDVVHRQESTRYMVSLLGRYRDQEAHINSESLYRDRKAFTKQMLRPFLKNALQREAWSGAPWTLKPRIAEQYRISQDIPKELTYDYQLAQRKAAIDAKKGKPTQQEQQQLRQKQFIEYKRAVARDPSIRPDQSEPKSHSDPHFIKFMNQNPNFTAKSIERPPPPPPLKYPREDLELGLQGLVRPSLKFLSAETQTDMDSEMDGVTTEIDQRTVGLLLETWNTLNVYCEVFVLDSFTFDDYVEALQFTADQLPSELVNEIHCAILKKLVNSENDKNGSVQISLPLVLEDEETDESEASAVNTPTPEPEIKPRTTRSSLAKSEAAEIMAQAAEDAKLHNGTELDQCVRGYDWKARLRKRDFANGKWVVIIAGLLNLYSRVPRLKDQCDEILKVLAPKDFPATEEMAIEQYYSTGISMRVRILQFLCTLSISTKAVREYMEECSASMTEYRKEKIEWQRKKKALIEDLKKLDAERRELQPASAADPGLEELAEQAESEVKEEEEAAAADADDGNGLDSDSDLAPKRSLRRGTDRAADRKKRIEEERLKKAKLEAEKARKPTKEERRLEKVLKAVDDVRAEIRECEDEVADRDNDLREADCQRTRVLGLDRFWNRYYWFERNGMPFGGLPQSSTAEAEYANGRLWVQGPDEIERAGFIEMNAEDNAKYRDFFGVTVPERKMREEGETHVFDARQWGYFDESEDVDKLIAWLDVKGVRELKLRKQLLLYQPHIETSMRKRKAYLENTKSERDVSEEAPHPAKRVSTRTKTYVDTGNGRRFDRWRNLSAINGEGHLHSEPPRPTKKGVATRVVSGRTKPAAPLPKEESVVESRQTRASGKPKGKVSKGYSLR